MNHRTGGSSSSKVPVSEIHRGGGGNTLRDTSADSAGGEHVSQQSFVAVWSSTFLNTID